MEISYDLAQKEELLQSLFRLKNPDTIHTLAEHAVVRRYQAGEKLYGLGELHQQVIFLLDGIAQYEYYDEGNRRRVMGFIGERGYPLVTPSSTHKTLSMEFATTELTTLEVPVQVIAPMLESDLELMWVYNQLMHWAIMCYSELVMMLRMSSAQRYAWMRKTMPGLDEKATGKDIASFLGITPETLSRLRKQYATEPLPKVTGIMCDTQIGRDMRYLKNSARQGYHQFGVSGAVEDLAGTDTETDTK